MWVVGYPEELEEKYGIADDEKEEFFKGILKAVYEKFGHLLGENDVFEIDCGGTEFPPYTITLYKDVLLL